MPTSARHDDEQTGERLAALTRQGRDAMPEQGCDGEPFANTPQKNTGIAEVHTERACSTGEKEIGKESQQKITR